jgi:predicted MFS family arabinose efflux permease
MLLVAFGTVGLIGVLTGDIESRVGMAHLLRIIFVSSFASLALLGLTPGNVPAVVVSAGLQGACVMTISAVFAFWSLRLFPNLPSISFTTVLLVYAGGNVAGPALAGLLAARTGPEATFLGAAGLSLLTALLLPRHVRRGKSRAT